MITAVLLAVTAAPVPPSALPAATVQEEAVREPKSKVSFPVSGPAPRGEGTQHLAGVAIRTKTFLRVKVYAYGLYVDKAGAQKALAPFKGKSAKDLAKDEAFYGKLLEDNFAKSVRMVFCRDVDGDDIREAFEKDLGPRIKDAATNRGMPNAEAHLAKFKTYFKLDELKKNGEILFTWYPGGRLVTKINGEFKEDIQSPTLSWAVFDIFLGKKPVMKKGKQTVVARMPGLLQ